MKNLTIPKIEKNKAIQILFGVVGALAIIIFILTFLLKDSNTNKEILNSNLVILNEENDFLHQQLEMLEDSISTLHITISSLKSTLNLQDQRISELEKNISELINERNSLYRRIKKISSSLNLAVNETETSYSRIRMLQDSLNLARVEQTNISNEANAVKVALDDERRKRNESNANLHAANDRAEKIARELFISRIVNETEVSLINVKLTNNKGNKIKKVKWKKNGTDNWKKTRVKVRLSHILLEPGMTFAFEIFDVDNGMPILVNDDIHGFEGSTSILAKLRGDNTIELDFPSYDLKIGHNFELRIRFAPDRINSNKKNLLKKGKFFIVTDRKARKV